MSAEAKQAGTPGTRTERTFIAIKPDGVQRGLVGEIIKRFEQKGWKLAAMKLTKPTKAKAEGHYDDLKALKFFPALTDFFSSGPIVAMVWEGEGVIVGGRKLLGATKPSESAPGTIRGDFAVNVGRNVVHGSDSPDAAAREIAFWFSAEEVFEWEVTNSKWVYE